MVREFWVFVAGFKIVSFDPRRNTALALVESFERVKISMPFLAIFKSLNAFEAAKTGEHSEFELNLKAWLVSKLESRKSRRITILVEPGRQVGRIGRVGKRGWYPGTSRPSCGAWERVRMERR